MTIQQHQSIGRRDENQDRILKIEKPHGFLIAVADGHGQEGSQVAEAALRAVEEMGLTDWKYPFDVRAEQTHRKILAQTREFSDSGSTLSIFYHIHGESFIYQVGDSPIFVKTGDTIQEFRGHGVDIAENIEDLKRAVAAGGELKLINRSFYLTGGNSALKLTRALGNSVFGGIVSQTPLIQKIKGKVDAVLVASDGFNGGKQEVLGKMKKKQDLAELVQGQKTRGIADNLSMNLVYLT